MIWNTIAHPKMMTSGGGLGTNRTYSPIKFADPHKLSFYDIIVSMTGTIQERQLILVKGDFETIKKMLLDGEAVCGAVFKYLHNDEIASLNKLVIENFSYSYVFDTITLEFDGNPLYLLNDNTISTTEPNVADDPAFVDPTSPGALVEP